jgi:hypothetical protein
MDESKLLEECVNINLTPLQTILLSRTVCTMNALIEFLIDNNCVGIVRVTEDNDMAPASEQTGNILIKSASTAMKEIRTKVWEHGRDAIGEIVPEEFNEVVEAYSILIEQIAYTFIELLRDRGI